jgi:hypothetical protein
MTPLFLTTILSCNQLNSVVSRLESVALLSYKQKIEIINELKKVVPSCPLIIKSNDRTQKRSN